MSETPTIQSTDQKSVDHRADAVDYLRNSSEGIGNVVNSVENPETFDLTEQVESINTTFWETPSVELDAPIYSIPEKTPAERIGESANYLTDKERVQDIAAVSAAIPPLRHYARQDYALGA